MTAENQETPPATRPSYEDTPLTRAEYIAAIVHLYRGELHRSTLWRIRLDTTTNWAVLTTAGLLAGTFREAKDPHWPLLIGLLLITLLLGYEARRFRFFDLWRSRVRKIEENFYAPILRRDPVSSHSEWGAHVADDLFEPRFKLSYLGALRARFTSNYWAVFAVLQFSWIIKVVMHSDKPHDWPAIQKYLTAGPLPWWVPLAFAGSFAFAALMLVLLVPRERQLEDEFWYTPSEQSSVSGLDV